MTATDSRTEEQRALAGAEKFWLVAAGWVCLCLFGGFVLLLLVFEGRLLLRALLPMLACAAGTALLSWPLWRRWPLALPFSCLLGCVPGILWALVTRPEKLTDEQLRAEGDALVQTIEAHHARTGRYPESLPGLELLPSWEAHGGWDYEARAEGRRYRLGCGNYDLDGFELYRYSERGVWEWDG